MLNEGNKTIQFDKLHCWYYRWEGFMKIPVDMASVPSFIKTFSGIQKFLERKDIQMHRHTQTSR
jgi:hypothetical protein